MFDVFLSHNSDDKEAVEFLATKLRNCGLKPWLDKWHLIPGTPWQPAIEQALAECSACAVFIGKNQIAPWQAEEMRTAIQRRVDDDSASFRVIPVLLPGGARGKYGAMPSFLTATTWVEFPSIDDLEAFHRLLCGIKGIQPGQEAEPGSTPRRMEFCITVDCSPSQFRRIMETAEKFLQTVSGDATLTIKYFRSGSVHAVIECTEESFRKLRALFVAGRLPDLLGFRIKDIQEQSNSLDAVGSATPQSVEARLDRILFRLECSEGEEHWFGTGFFISSDGLALTAFHNLPEGDNRQPKPLVAAYKGRRIEFERLLSNRDDISWQREFDIAVLKGPEGLVSDSDLVSCAYSSPDASSEERSAATTPVLGAMGFPVIGLMKNQPVYDPVGLRGELSVTQGISGAPVYDLELDAIVGVVQAISSDGLFACELRYLAQHWPPFREVAAKVSRRLKPKRRQGPNSKRW